MQELLKQLPWTISVLQSFDPMSLRNNIAIAAALREAARRGFTCALTGDGADEIMGGYNFTHRMSDERWLEHRGERRRRLSKYYVFGMHQECAPGGCHSNVTRAMGSMQKCLSLFAPHAFPGELTPLAPSPAAFLHLL